MVHIHNGILYSQKKKKILPFATTYTELEGIMLSELSQAEKDKYQMISLVWSISTKQKMKEQNSSRLAEPKNGLTVTKGKGTGEDGWEGRDQWKKRGITISRQYRGATGRAVLYNTEKTSRDSIASYYADGH